MVFIAIILLTVVLPVASVLVEHLARPEAAILMLMGKWFVFWGCGVRLLLAGFTQALRPQFTAKGIFEIEDPKAEKIVVELGYANISMGLAAALSLVMPPWTAPAGLVAGLFLLLDGIKHVANTNRNSKENLALVTDLIVAAAVAVYLVYWVRFM